MGPPEKQPPLPEFEWCTVPLEQSYVCKRLQECNWLQSLEGGINSSHSAWLHGSEFKHDPLYVGAKGNEYTLGDVQPHFEVVESPGGLLIGARRNAEAGNYYWRITQWIMPCMTMIPPRGDHPTGGHYLGADRRRDLLGLELGLSSRLARSRRRSGRQWTTAQAAT